MPRRFRCRGSVSLGGLASRGEEPLDEFQGQPHDVGRASRDQAEGKTLVLESARTGLSLPEPALEIPIEESVVERPHFELAFIGGAERFSSRRGPEADPGDNAVRSTGKGLEHPSGFSPVGGLPEFPAVDFAEGVAGQDEPADSRGRHGSSFCPSEPEDVGFEGFIGASARCGGFCFVRRRDDVDLPAGFGGKLPPPW